MSKSSLHTGLAALALSLALTCPSLAQQEWQPFKERDERAAAAARARRAAEQQPPALPSVDRGVLSQQPDQMAPDQSANSAPGLGANAAGFTPPPKSTIERVELAPIEPVQQQPQQAMPSQPGSSAAIPGALPSMTPGIVSRGSEQRVAAPAQATPRDLPDDLWRGVDMKALESLIAPLDVPPKSAGMHALWTRIIGAKATPPAGAKGQNHYLALQLEALYRSGLIAEMKVRLEQPDVPQEDPLILMFKVRQAMAAADTDVACAGVKKLAAKRSVLPKALMGEVHLLSGYCTALTGNAAAAGLAAELAREEEVEAPVALAVLDTLALGPNSAKPRVSLPKRLQVLDYRLMELLDPVEPTAVLANAEPALLYSLSQTDGTPPKLAIAAAEAAAGMHALSPDNLAEVYARVTLPANGASDPLFKRAQLFKSLTASTAPQQRLQTMRQLIDDGRRSGLGLVLARALAKPMADIKPTAELGALAATAAEIAIAQGDYERARQFAAASPQAAGWAPLAEMADPRIRGVSEAALVVLDDQVRRNRFDAKTLHRLATVLDALDTNVPIPLWEAASNTPQPNTGHLPETGVLPQMQDAAKKQELGRTALLVMRSIGPAGPDQSHLIALADSIRALRRAGLETDARLLAMEALFAAWPRG